MKPIGPLMKEHRLIERIIALLSEELRRITGENRVDVEVLIVAIDFIRTYADRTHHGKEEDILFKALVAKKTLSQEHRRMIEELIEEHACARKMTSRLADATEDYVNGNAQSSKEIAGCIKKLTDLYPTHIEKEDRHFFFPILEYLTKQEQYDMLGEFWEFDRKLIHEKYETLVQELEGVMGNKP